jgi:hypothetical protein
VDGDRLRIERVIVTVQRQAIEKELAKTDATRRYVALPAFLRDMILSQESDYATTLTARAIYGQFVHAMQRAGFSGVRFHDLRHISASDMHAHGITDRVAAERGGWAGTQTMQQVYQHTFSADRQSADKTMLEYYSNLYDATDATQETTQETTHDDYNHASMCNFRGFDSPHLLFQKIPHLRFFSQMRDFISFDKARNLQNIR